MGKVVAVRQGKGGWEPGTQEGWMGRGGTKRWRQDRGVMEVVVKQGGAPNLCSLGKSEMCRRLLGANHSKLRNLGGGAILAAEHGRMLRRGALLRPPRTTRRERGTRPASGNTGWDRGWELATSGR